MGRSDHTVYPLVCTTAPLSCLLPRNCALCAQAEEAARRAEQQAAEAARRAAEREERLRRAAEYQEPEWVRASEAAQQEDDETEVRGVCGAADG